MGFARNHFPNSNFNFKPQIDKIKKKDLVHNTSEIQENTTYDNFGNVLQQTHTIYNNQNYTTPYLQQESTTSTYTDEGSWLDWQPEDVTVTTTRYGETPVSVTSNYLYETGTGNLTEERFQYGTEAEVVTTYQYFTEGNLQTQTVTPQNMAARVSSYTYTTDRRFVKTETNPLGWVTEYDYDHTLGVVTSETDNENNLQTSFAHDDFGRITLTTYPDGNTESVNRVWDLATTFGQSLFYTETTGSNQPSAQKWYDGQVREIRSKHKNRNDDWVFVRTIYDSKGRVWKKSLPYLSGGSMNYSVTTYDNYGRPLTKTSPSGTSISYAYSGRTTTTTNTSTNQSTSKTMDATGELVSATDDGGTITYHYNSWGKPRQIDGPASSTIITYDDQSGRQLTLHDPAAGLMQYEYNAAGELTRQEDAAGNVFTMTYDKLGRITAKNGPDGSYSYAYDADFTGKIDSRTSPDGIVCTYQYDNLGRPKSYTERIDGVDYEFGYSYDANGNLLHLSYPNGFVAEHNYDSYAYPTDIRNANDQSLIWQYTDENEIGQITEYQLGETPIFKTYDPLSGLPQEHYNAPGTFNYSYDFNSQTGNLTTRTDVYNSLDESFDYDDLDRLTGYTTSLGNSIYTAFSSTGDISQKTDVGTYVNDPPTGRTNEIDGNPNTISNISQTITYTPFHSVRSIMEGDFDASFEYGPDDQRRKMIITQAGAPYRERVYVAGGLYERDFYNGQWRNLAYINTPTGQEAVVITGESTQDQNIFFLNRDYLGSIISIVDAEGGILLEEYSYDAWGNRRDPQTWQNQYNPGQNNNLWTGLLYRGYTGHEHLDCFGLINMNGRLYDPLLGRMLSPDNFVQNAGFSQNFNRYAYVYNNPLKFTDPSGEIIFTMGALIAAPFTGGASLGALSWTWKADAVFMAGAWGGGSLANNNINPGQWDWNSSNTWGGMLTGGVIATATAFGVGLAAGKLGVGLSVGTKKGLLAGISGGNLNTLLNYDSENGFGFSSLAYWGAGFVGGYTGGTTSLSLGMGAGGVANVAAGAFSGNVTDAYSLAQHFVGGALSAYSGVGLAGKVYKSKPLVNLFGKSKFAKSWAGKGLSGFVDFGIQSSASDFAYTSQEKYLKRSFRDHLGIFAGGGMGSFIQSAAYGLDIKLAEDLVANKLLISTFAYSSSFALTGWAKNSYSGIYTDYWFAKTAINLYKIGLTSFK